MECSDEDDVEKLEKRGPLRDARLISASKLLFPTLLPAKSGIGEIVA